MDTLGCVADAQIDDACLLVAFASMDGDMVDQHFGSAQAFYLYAISSDAANLLASQSFGVEKKDGNEDKLKPKLAWLAGADIVYCGSIGGSATRQLLALGVHPLKVKGGPDVKELIEELQLQLNGDKEAWLEKLLQRKSRASDEDRFAAMDDEGWDG
ncbi:NifB/NifX family molybdenum-iron cluster-binding protein [Haliea sp. E17]|uniref:NifB/NifX family molybdenum-iron cluster-binding protein n=1 Tax=Haliea sp. E17 TaxID=3401576 RepID=UPI003AABF9B2